MEYDRPDTQSQTSSQQHRAQYSAKWEPYAKPQQAPSSVETAKKEDSTPPLIRPKRVYSMVLIGLIIFHIGLLILSSMLFLDSPDSDDYDGDYDAYEDARGQYRDTVRNMLGTGRITIIIGGLMGDFALIGNGLGNTTQNNKIRAVSISAGIALAIAILVILSLFNPLSYMIW